MAVVSISRIQIRRGRKNSGTGMPQLASGELGWAIDTQELFIGNGSVSEGAPAVGNTKLLTEFDDLFQLANTYIYDIDSGLIQTGSTGPVQRTLQQRLDDRVSVKAFGCNGDGTDCTEQLQRAINQLYLTGNRRIALYMEAGEYLISDTITIPPYTTIIGDGSDKTIIKQTSPKTVFSTTNSEDDDESFINQSRYVTLKGMSLDVSNVESLPMEEPVMVFQSCRDSIFEDIRFLGSLLTLNNESIAITMNGLSELVTCKNNTFKNIDIENFNYSIKVDSIITNNIFEHCIFKTVNYGIVLDSLSDGPKHNTFNSCFFEDVNQHAIWIIKGQYNLSTNNKFYRVGNDGGNNAQAQHSVLVFNDDFNISTNDFFERADDLSTNLSRFGAVPFVPLVEGSAFFEYDFSIKIPIGNIQNEETIFRLPANQTGSYKINYWYKSNNSNRSKTGVLDIAFDKENNLLSITDDYSYLGSSLYNRSLTFTVELADEDGDATVETLLVNAINPIIGENADLYFNIAFKG